MAALVCLVVMLAMVGASDGAWCVCRSDVSDSALQKTIDYACGAGADCTPLVQGGSCYNPNTVRAHCSYAANSYYQRKGQGQQQGCDFSGTATLTTTDPSASTCTYPSSSSAAGTSTSTPTSTTSPGSTTTTTPGSSTTTPGSSTTTPSSTTPTTYTPTTGTGGVLGGLGPSGNSISTDSSDGGLLPRPEMASLFAVVIVITGLVMLEMGG